MLRTRSHHHKRPEQILATSYSRRTRKTRASHPELTQVMIHVQIAPPHPVLLAHLAEHRMRTENESPRIRRECVYHRQQSPHVCRKLRGGCPAKCLIEFRPGRHPGRPLEGRIQHPHFHQRPQVQSAHRLHGLFAHNREKCVAKMADHLRGVHAPPPAGRLRTDILHARANFASAFNIRQGLHSCPVSNRRPFSPLGWPALLLSRSRTASHVRHFRPRAAICSRRAGPPIPARQSPSFQALRRPATLACAATAADPGPRPCLSSPGDSSLPARTCRIRPG
jgi:hypothetical protein